MRRSLGLHEQAAADGCGLNVDAELPQGDRGVERANLALLLPGVEAGLRREVVQQRAQRGNAAVEHAQPLVARAVRLQHARHVRNDAEIAAKVVRGFAPRFGPLTLELPELLEPFLERVHPARCLDALHALVLGDAFADAAHGEPADASPRFRDDRRRQVQAGMRIRVHLLRDGVAERNPLLHHLSIVVALAPALHAVSFGAVGLVLPRLERVVEASRPERVFEGVEKVRNVIVELDAGHARRCPQVGITLDGVPPGGQDRLAALAQVRGERGKLDVAYSGIHDARR